MTLHKEIQTKIEELERVAPVHPLLAEGNSLLFRQEIGAEGRLFLRKVAVVLATYG
jgi:hypothetical protein